MGEPTASDCSWKKMVIAKANDQWISTIKSEQTDIDDVGNVAFNNEHIQFNNVKSERIEISLEPQHIHDERVVPEADDDLSSESDPLLIDDSSLKRRRRKNSVGGFKNETPDERTARLAKMSAYAAQRLANESPEQRAQRLKRMSEYAAKRLAQETSDQRAKRLARMSAYAARRLAEETPEQRKARLARMSAYAARRHALKKAGNSSTSEIPNSMAFYSQITNDMPDQS